MPTSDKNYIKELPLGRMRSLTICACASRTFIDKDKVASIAAAAKKAGMKVELVADLCELCETKDKKVGEIAQTTIIACHSRAVKSLIAFAARQVSESCQYIDLRSQSVEEVLELLGIDAADSADAEEWRQQIADFPKKLGEDAWYPTLDKDACAECGKCLEFCPFGVYEMVDDRITVTHPHHCKNNCPACARQCPTSAIIFPKYDRSPINGGKELQEKAIRLDSKELYGEVLRQKLIERRGSIFRS